MTSRRSARRWGAAVALGYLFGTFPTADLVARRASGGTVDLRRSGSGNPGAANAMQVLGRRPGMIVMGVDIAKGALAAVVGGVLGGPTAAHAAGTAAVVGHCVPVWNGGRGGKGVGASVGQCLVTFPASLPIDLAVAASAAANPRSQRRASAATLAACICWVVGAVLWWRRQLPNLWGPRPTIALPLASVASSAMVAYRFITASAPGTVV